MNRMCLLLLVGAALAGTGCQSAKPRILISPSQKRTLQVELTGGLAPAPKGGLIVTTSRMLARYDPDQYRLTELLESGRRDIVDVAVTPRGALLVLCDSELCAYVPGHLVTLHALPGRAVALSCDREFAYLLLEEASVSRLVRITLEGKERGVARTLLVTEDHPQAIAALPGGCLVASGGNIVKVTDPAPAATGKEDAVETALLVALPEPVTGLAPDPDRLILYFATADSTYAWTKGQIVPVFPAGGRLLLARNTLTICLPDGTDSQMIQIPRVNRHTATLLKAASPKPR